MIQPSAKCLDRNGGTIRQRAMHRAWINIKSVVTSGDDHAILAECERGEDSAVDEYKKAMEDELASPLRETISRQYSEIKSARDRVKQLRDVTK